MDQLEKLTVGTCMMESEGKRPAKQHQVTVTMQTFRWVYTQKNANLARCRLVVTSQVVQNQLLGQESMHLRIFACSVVSGYCLLTADVSTAFMHAPVEEGAVDLVLLPSHMTIDRGLCCISNGL